LNVQERSAARPPASERYSSFPVLSPDCLRRRKKGPGRLSVRYSESRSGSGGRVRSASLAFGARVVSHRSTFGTPEPPASLPAARVAAGGGGGGTMSLKCECRRRNGGTDTPRGRRRWRKTHEVLKRQQAQIGKWTRWWLIARRKRHVLTHNDGFMRSIDRSFDQSIIESGRNNTCFINRIKCSSFYTRHFVYRSVLPCHRSGDRLNRENQHVFSNGGASALDVHDRLLRSHGGVLPSLMMPCFRRVLRGSECQRLRGKGSCW
jgi:hypothetical protein